MNRRGAEGAEGRKRATGVETLSVIQVRTQDILPTSIENLVISALRQFESELDIGALVSVDKDKIDLE